MSRRVDEWESGRVDEWGYWCWVLGVRCQIFGVQVLGTQETHHPSTRLPIHPPTRLLDVACVSHKPFGDGLRLRDRLIDRNLVR
jgi:hypothetical protein